MTAFPVSVIIPTFNRAGKLPHLLDSLMRQSYQDFELVIVVDGSTDESVRILNNRKNDFLNMRIVEQENSGRAIARNRGASDALGDLLIFYDDDVRPEPDSVIRHVEFHRNYSGSVGCGMPVEDKSAVRSDFQAFRLHLSGKWTEKYRDALNTLSFENLFFTAANCSIPGSIFRSLGGFDTSLPDAEDYELALRALLKGYRVFFQKNNIVYHDENTTCAMYIRRVRQYTFAHQVIRDRYSSLPLSIAVRGNRFAALMKKPVFLAFGNRQMVRWIDRNRFSWLPAAIRFLIYDLTVTGLGIKFPGRKMTVSTDSTR
jgi:glycosyltransferase involved in cell wall biosynthesis